MSPRTERNVPSARGIGKSSLERKSLSYTMISVRSFCLGCPLKSNNQEFKYTSGNLAIEWESSAYYLGYLSNREQVTRACSVRTSMPMHAFVLLGCGNALQRSNLSLVDQRFNAGRTIVGRAPRRLSRIVYQMGKSRQQRTIQLQRLQETTTR